MIEYKQKYLQLRSKFIKAVDVAFRAGYEKGLKESKLLTLNQQMDTNNGGGIDFNTNNTGVENRGINTSNDNNNIYDNNLENSSELDNSITELENLVAKGEKPTVLNMRNAVMKISDLRKKQKMSVNQVEDSNKKQKQVVRSLMAKIEEEERKANENSVIEKIIKNNK
jgi:hypothetical protein